MAGRVAPGCSPPTTVPWSDHGLARSIRTWIVEEHELVCSRTSFPLAFVDVFDQYLLGRSNQSLVDLQTDAFLDLFDPVQSVFLFGLCQEISHSVTGNRTRAR